MRDLDHEVVEGAVLGGNVVAQPDQARCGGCRVVPDRTALETVRQQPLDIGDCSSTEDGSPTYVLARCAWSRHHPHLALCHIRLFVRVRGLDEVFGCFQLRHSL
eukprot:4197846-Lingulodinium_polyedra.AAC.1